MSRSDPFPERMVGEGPDPDPDPPGGDEVSFAGSFTQNRSNVHCLAD
jgi:hypothetical protein